jgi:hypothetical protein
MDGLAGDNRLQTGLPEIQTRVIGHLNRLF